MKTFEPKIKSRSQIREFASMAMWITAIAVVSFAWRTWGQPEYRDGASSSYSNTSKLP